MKQAQFRRAAQSPGFRSIQVTGGEISRMREESSRVIQGMRDVRDAEIKNRERELADVKENQRAEAAARERNYQIQTQNQKRELTGLQLEARARQQQFEADQQAQAEIFKGVAEFSETAGKAYAQYLEAKDKKDFNEGWNEYLQNPSKNKIRQAIIGEKIQDEAEELRQQGLDAAEIAGGNELGIAIQRNYSGRVRRELDKAIFFNATKTHFSSSRNVYIQEKADAKGSPLTSAEIAGYTAEFTEIWVNRGSEAIGNRLKPEGLRTVLEWIQDSSQKYLSGEREKQLEYEKKISIDQETKIIDQNPLDFSSNIIPSFYAVARGYGGPGRPDYAKAHDWLADRAKLQLADGSFNLDLDQLANIILPGDKKPYALARPGRFAEIKRARQQAENSFRSQQITADNLSFKEDETRVLAMLAEDGSQSNANAAIEYFRKTWAKVPDSIQKYSNSYTIEAVAKAKQIEQIQAIPDGFIKQEDVDALSYLDPTAGRELSQRFAAQERKYNQGVFKDQSESFKTIANGVTSFGSQKPNTPASVFLQQAMRSEYRRRVDQAVAGGADFNTAANTIAQQLSTEVSTGARDPNSKWYRKASKPGGAADFPNLNTGNISSVEQAKRNYKALQNSVANNGLEKTLDTPESIITADEAAVILQTYGKPGFVIPTDVLAVAGMGNGTDPFTIINRQLRALNLVELQPPQITKDINNEVSPEFRKQLYNPNNGSRQKLRALRQGFGGTFGSAGSMRVGSPMRRTAGSRQENAFIQTIRTVEGTSGPNGYNTVYGGAVVPQLTQMTLGELYDATKLGGTDAIPARLGGGKIPFKKDQYNSSASGALQLMPETLRGLVENGGYSWNDVFSPETQDRMILDLARQGGVDIENMSPAQMEKAGNIWAGASPRYGQTTRTASDSYGIYQSLLQQ
jgi:muramidase (phage lysozyme)